MENLICKICGSHIFNKITENEYQCKHCGFTKIINNTNEESTLLIDAHKTLNNFNYIEAEDAFDEILRKYPNSYEALWGKIVSHHGIVFVNENGNIYPTFHDFSVINFLEEDLYKKFLTIVPDNKKDIYISLAKQIEKLRLKYYELVKEEKPYDIFISFKQSDETGNDTIDKKVTDKINTNLKNKGYRVFYSPETLQNKIGSEYEPFIYHALRTSKVLITYGQKEEYFNATWVKNEWGRFLKMQEYDENKHIIVCYENMLTRDLPAKLRKLQALDLGNESAYNTLDDTIKLFIKQKVIDTIDELKIETDEVKKKGVSKEEITYINIDDNKGDTNSPDIDIKLSIAKDYLDKDRFDIALDKYQKILSEHPNNANALLGVILSKNKINLLDNIKVIASNIKLISEAIKSTTKTDAINIIINPITNSLCNYLKDSELDENVSIIYNCLNKFKYDEFNTLNDLILNKAIEYGKYDLFIGAIKYLDSNNVDEHINLRVKMQNSLIKLKKYDEALKIINDTLEIEEGNNISLYNKLLCHIKDSPIVSKMDDEGFKLFDTLLLYSKEKDKYTEEYITKISKQQITLENINVYKELLRRIQSKELLISKSYEIGELLKVNGLFEGAKIFYNYFIQNTSSNKELGYVGILLCSYNSKTIEDLINQDKDFTKSNEYENVLVFSKIANEDLYKEYFKCEENWKKDKINKQKKFEEKINRLENIFNSPYKKEGDYIYFGTYPQTIKDKNVKILEKINYNNNEYYLGTDKEIYVKIKAKPYKEEYTFSNGEKVIKDNEYYFKVEPVKWRILSQNNGEYFIFSDKILNDHRFDSLSNNYDTSEVKSYLNNEMYNEMFSEKQKEIILETKGKNIEIEKVKKLFKTVYVENEVIINLGKLFLLSEEEIIYPSYGFNSSISALDTARRKQVTDYAVANNVYYNTDEEYLKNGPYWLRTPYKLSSGASGACYVGSRGCVYCSSVTIDYGLAPALKITVR